MRSDRPLPRKPHGRPLLYDSKVHDELAYLCGLCEYSIEEACSRIGVCQATFYNWLEKFPNFLEKWEEGKRAIREGTFISSKKRIEGYIAIEEREKVSHDGKVSKEVVKREIPPDSALLIKMLDRIDKKSTDDGQNQLQKLMDMLLALDPSLLEKVQASSNSSTS